MTRAFGTVSWTAPKADPLVAKVLALVLALNLLQHLVLPRSAYVPFNLVAAIGCVALALHHQVTMVELGLSRRHLRRGLLGGLGTAVLVVLVLVIAMRISSVRSGFEDIDLTEVSGAGWWFNALIRIPLGTAVFEEILFRAVLLAALIRRVGNRKGALYSSAVFGLWHVAPAWKGASGSLLVVAGSILSVVVVTFVAGLLFCWLRLRTQSVLASTLAHTATNVSAFVAALIVQDLI